MSAVYDHIGAGYGLVRRPDPRLAALITGALGGARTVVNVGAGAGSYEPASARVVAVEPSAVILAQHPGASRVQAAAEALPLATDSFDAAMAIMTIHHWADLQAGLAEMRRVSRRQVVFTWDKDHDEELWVISEYLPEIRTMERQGPRLKLHVRDAPRSRRRAGHAAPGERPGVRSLGPPARRSAAARNR